MNILILSAGTRNKIVQYFRKTFNGSGIVVAVDASNLGPAIYEADKFYIVPSVTEDGYIDRIIEICLKEKIDGILSLIDPELSILAENTERLKEAGATVIGSSYELCEMALDKYSMFRWLVEHDYRCPKAWKDKEDFFKDVEKGAAHYPVYIKPVRGSASIGLFKAEDRESVELLFNHEDGLMIQEVLAGNEIGADIYVDMISGKTVSVFTKKKLKMRAGETDKSVSFKSDKLFELLGRFVEEAGFRGQVDIDLFEKDGEYYILEVNPRFGGGYPHAYECGCDHMKLIIENLEGNINEPEIGNYEEGICMMKYSEVMIRKLDS